MEGWEYLWGSWGQ